MSGVAPEPVWGSSGAAVVGVVVVWWCGAWVTVVSLSGAVVTGVVSTVVTGTVVTSLTVGGGVLPQSVRGGMAWAQSVVGGVVGTVVSTGVGRHSPLVHETESLAVPTRIPPLVGVTVIVAVPAAWAVVVV
jgi:hypothetical protein